MTEATIDRLEIEIESGSSAAVAKVDALYSSLKKLQKITNGFSSNGAGKAIRNIGAAAEKAMPASVQRKRVAVKQATKTASSSGAGRKAQSVKTAVLDASGTTKVDDIGEVEKASRGLEDVAAAATRAKGGLDGAANAEKNTTRTSEILHAALSGLGKAFNSFMVSGANKFGNVLKNIGKRFTNNFIGPIKNSIKAFEKWKSSIARVSFYRAVRTAIKMVTDGFKEGIENLYYFSQLTNSQFAPAMDSLATSSLYLKNSLGAVAAPLIQAVAPAVNYLIDLFVSLLNVINMVFAVLGGGGSYTKAVRKAAKYGEDLNKSMGGGAAAAKELKRYLIGIDELNVMPEQPDSGGGGGGGGGLDTSYEDMFVETPLPDWVKNIKDAIDAGGWFRAGELLADKLNELIDKIDGEAWGRKLGSKIQKGIEFALGFLRNVHWEKLGSEAAGFINGIIETVNPENLGALLAEKVRIAVDIAYGFIDRLKWDKLGDWVGGVINGWFEDINWPKLGMTIGEGVKGLLTTINHALDTTDWKQIGIDIGNALKNIDWKGIWDGLLLALDNAIDAIGGVAEGLGDSLGTAWDWISLIGIAFASWKISSSVLGWFNNVSNGAFSKQLEKMHTSLAGITAKLAIAITGFTLEFTGIKGIVENGWDLKDAIKAALGTAIGVTAGAWLFNFSPLGWAISITTALVIGIAATIETNYEAKQLEFESSDLGQKIKEWKEDAARAEDVTKTINLKLETSMQDYQTAASDIEAIKQMIEDAFALDEIEVKTDAQQAKLQALIDTINTSGIENVHLDLDPDGKIVQTRDSLLEVTDALIKQAQAEAAMEGYRNAYQAQVEAEANIAMIRQGIADTTALVAQKTEELAAAQEELNTHQNMGWDDAHLQPYVEAVQNAKLGLEGAMDAQESWNAQIESAQGALSTANAYADVYVEELKDLQQASSEVASAQTEVKDATSEASEVLSSATEGIDAYKDSVSSVSDSISGVADSASAMQSTVADATANVGGSFSDLTGTITGENSTMNSDSDSRWKAIKQSVTDAAEYAQSKTTSAWKGINDVIKQKNTDVASDIEKTWSSIKSKMSDSLSSIQNAVQTNIELMKSSISSGMSEITGTMNKSFQTLKNNASSWGGDIAKNIANGMRNNSSYVINAANALANNIKARLHFSEPDEGPLSDFHTYMPDMLKMMARGIRENAGIAVAAANDLAQSISDAFSEAEYAMSFDDFDFDGEYEYSISGNDDYGESDYDEYVDVSIDESAIRESNEEVINALYAMGQRIIEAINNKDANVYLGRQKLTSAVTHGQNQQNRASGKSLSNAYGGA